MTSTLIKEQTPRELRWGDWSPGRFAWFTEPLMWFKTPIPCRGMQGVFTLPDEVMAQIARIQIDGSPAIADWKPRPKTKPLFEDEG